MRHIHEDKKKKKKKRVDKDYRTADPQYLQWLCCEKGHYLLAFCDNIIKWSKR